MRVQLVLAVGCTAGCGTGCICCGCRQLIVGILQLLLPRPDLPWLQPRAGGFGEFLPVQRWLGWDWVV
jgi:hypothetical protein